MQPAKYIIVTIKILIRYLIRSKKLFRYPKINETVMVVTMLKIRRSLASFQRYSSSHSGSLGFNRNELQDRVKKSGIELHLPQDEVQVKRRSLAVLVGWAESRQKALSKFAAIYTKQGIPCLTIASPITSMWFTSVGNKLTNSLLTSLDLATPLDDHPDPINLALHIFSGGGTAVFPRLVEELAKPNGLLTMKIRPKCVIFDSGPTQFSYESGMAAARLVYKQGGFNYLTYTASRLGGGTVNFFIGSRKRSEMIAALDSPLLNMPQLYLYSTADSVCGSDWVEKVMEEQRKKGRTVESFRWQDSEHVRHMVEHTEQYQELVGEFLRKHFL